MSVRSVGSEPWSLVVRSTWGAMAHIAVSSVFAHAHTNPMAAVVNLIILKTRPENATEFSHVFRAGQNDTRNTCEAATSDVTFRVNATSNFVFPKSQSRARPPAFGRA